MRLNPLRREAELSRSIALILAVAGALIAAFAALRSAAVIGGALGGEPQTAQAIAGAFAQGDFSGSGGQGAKPGSALASLGFARAALRSLLQNLVDRSALIQTNAAALERIGAISRDAKTYEGVAAELLRSSEWLSAAADEQAREAARFKLS